MSTLINELENNLVTAREMGDAEWQARLEARIADLNKPAEKPKAPAKAATTSKAKGK